MQRKDDKKKDADMRNLARKGLSPQAQIKVLDFRLGKGVGAIKERTRLNALISRTSEKPVETGVEEVVVEKVKRVRKKQEKA